jgi:hypothetical protein
MFAVPRWPWLRCPAAWSLTCTAPWPGSSPKPSSTPPAWPATPPDGGASSSECIKSRTAGQAGRRQLSARLSIVPDGALMVAAGRWHGRPPTPRAWSAGCAGEVPSPATAEAAWPELRCRGRDVRPWPQVRNPPPPSRCFSDARSTARIPRHVWPAGATCSRPRTPPGILCPGQRRRTLKRPAGRRLAGPVQSGRSEGRGTWQALPPRLANVSAAPLAQTSAGGLSSVFALIFTHLCTNCYPGGPEGCR